MKYKFPLLSPLGLALVAFLNLNLSTKPSLATAAALPVTRTVAVIQTDKKPDIWDAIPPCASWGLEIGINDLHNPNVTLCGGRDPNEDPPFVLGSGWDWPCLCKARGGKGTAIKSAGIIFFFLNCGEADTFDVVFPAIEKFCEPYEKL